MTLDTVVGLAAPEQYIMPSEASPQTDEAWTWVARDFHAFNSETSGLSQGFIHGA